MFRPGMAKGPTLAPPLPSGSTPFPPTSPVIAPAWFRAGTFTHTQFQIAALTRSIALYTLPIKGVIHGVLLTPVAAFTGTGMTFYQITCGLAGTLDKYSSAYDVLITAPGNNVSQLLPVFVQENHVATTALLISAESDVNLSLSTAGSFTLDLLMSVTP